MANTPSRSFRCSDEKWEAVTARAEREGVLPADIVRDAINAYLSTETPQDTPAKAVERERARALHILDVARSGIAHGSVID